MFRINIILMLSTIIRDLDCCSSFTIFHRRSIHLYPAAGIELLMNKTAQFQVSHTQTPPSAASAPPSYQPPPPVERAEAQTNIWHKHLRLHLHSNNDKSDEDDEYFKLNRSAKSIVQNQEEQLEIKLSQELTSRSDYSNDNSSTVAAEETTTTNQIEDPQFKLISEIVSLECADILKLEFCLNGGRCFLYPILNHSLSSCECAEGFVGERCEAKSYEFIPRIRPRLILAKTLCGPLIYGLAFIDILFLLFLFCKNCNRD